MGRKESNQTKTKLASAFTRSDTGVVIDSAPHLSGMCKTSLLFSPFAVRVQAGCSAFPLTLRLNRKYNYISQGFF